MGRVAVVSYRLGLRDGVSIEAAKWTGALRRIGWDVRTVAGEGPVDVTVPGLRATDQESPRAEDLERALEGCELVVAENVLSLPLHPGARDVVADVLRGRPVLVHHHDLPWQRDHLRHEPPPPDDDAWRHVTINDLSRVDLGERGIESVRLYNHFGVNPAPGRRELTRELLEVPEHQPLLLAPTRAIPRKNLHLAARVARESGAILWILGPAEDDFDEELRHLLAELGAQGRHLAPPGVTIDDAYAACDAVAVTSTWEGFGNPVIEAFVHERPLVLYPYPVARELLAFGFETFSPDDPPGLIQEFREPDLERRQHNHEIVQRHFNLADLPEKLSTILAACGASSR
jgi:hypothetical protein